MLFKEIYEVAGIRTSSHSGRRTFATRLNAKGVGMRTIQKLMGHRLPRDNQGERRATIRMRMAPGVG
jgi:integrase